GVVGDVGGGDRQPGQRGAELDLLLGARPSPELEDADLQDGAGHAYPRSWSNTAGPCSRGGGSASGRTAGTEPLAAPTPCSFSRPAATIFSVRSRTISKL